MRSVTLTSMMFITPMPPTTRLIVATKRSMNVKAPAMRACISANSFWLRMVKSGSLP